MKKFDGYVLTEHELGCLGETMVELSHLCYDKVCNIVEDHTEAACIIRDAAVAFENKGNFWDEKTSDFYTELLHYSESFIKELERDREAKTDVNVRDANGSYYTGIINPYNGHNRKLVDAICDAWDKKKEDFAPILYSFCLRDRAEMSEKWNGFVPMTPEQALENAHEIMENICDDQDLECILKFLRVSY